MALETPRLELRPLTDDDAPFVLDLLNQPSFLRFIGDRGVRTLEDARAYIADGPLESYRSNGFGLLAVVVKVEAAPAGLCGVMRKPWLDDPDLAYAFLPRFWSQGYALEAASAVLSDARCMLGLGRVIAVVTPGNAASLRLLAKLGFVAEGTVADPATGAQLTLLASTPASSAPDLATPDR